MQKLNVTIIQADLVWENARANRDAFSKAIASIGEPTDIIVLPEMFTTGFSMSATSLAEPPDGDTVAWMRKLAAKENAAVCGSLIIAEGGRYYNRFIWMPPDGVAVSYDKRHLFRMAGEHEHYAAGKQAALVEYRGWRICPFVCYDLRFPVFCRQADTCDLMLFVANWPRPRYRAWRTLLSARAIENICYVAGVNRSGTDWLGVDYAGQSGVIDYTGEWLCDAGELPGNHTVTLDAGNLQKFRKHFPFHLDADRFSLNT